jgi:hypothetical protein
MPYCWGDGKQLERWIWSPYWEVFQLESYGRCKITVQTSLPAVFSLPLTVVNIHIPQLGVVRETDLVHYLPDVSILLREADTSL